MKIVSNKPTITRKELEGVLDCLINDELQTGNTVKEFEATLGRLVGLQYSLAANSLTSAYHLAFLALGISPGDEVIMPSFFHQAPLSALRLAGGQPVLVDMHEQSLSPSAEDIKEKITDKTKAIVAGHLFGCHASLDGIRETGIPVIEDISHAVGTEAGEAPVGQKSAFAVISFSPSMIITTGNGGMVLTNNSKHFSAMRDVRGGQEGALTMDYTMTDFQGAMGLSQLVRLSHFLKRRREIARIYHDALRITPHKAPYPYNDSFAYQSFPVLFDASNEKVEKYWRKSGIEILPANKHPLHQLLGLRGADYPHADRLSRKLYSVPLYPTLSRKDIDNISKTLSKFI